MKKISISILIAMVIALSSPVAYGEEVGQVTVGMKILDLIVVRPISIVVSTASTAIYLATVPITFPAGVSEPAARALVEAPWRFTGARYLGEFDHYKDGNPITIFYEK
ncbi:MAG: hypothetical protein QME90_01285 [Thermodesulfobacteriota bacterium]|nr:hypothetical protein [Thermodesulfobacteriota bacterium]